MSDRDELDHLFAFAADGIFVCGLDGRIVHVNPTACAISGYRPDELVGMHPWELVLDVSSVEILTLFRSLEPGLPHTTERVLRRPDGRTLDVDVRMIRVDDGGRPLVVASCRDATERKRLEREIREHEQSLAEGQRLSRGLVSALTHILDALAKERVPDRLLELVLRTISVEFEAHGITVWLEDERTGAVLLEFEFVDDRLLTRAESNHPAARMAWDTRNHPDWPKLSAGEPLLAEDFAKDWHGPAPYREHMIRLGIMTLLSVPMWVAGRVAGAVAIRFPSRRVFGDDAIALAQALAHEVMLAIQLTRLTAESRRTAVAAERNRFARDIHDTLAQGFTGVIVQLAAADDADGRGLDAEAGAHRARAVEMAREGLREARRSVTALRQTLLVGSDLRTALEALLARTAAGTSVRTRFSMTGTLPSLPDPWADHLLRIGQEAITNALRHAQAKEFGCHLVCAPDEIRLELRDDGIGFDLDSVTRGFGLIGIAERVAAMNARFDVVSAPNTGTVITVAVPLTQ